DVVCRNNLLNLLKRQLSLFLPLCHKLSYFSLKSIWACCMGSCFFPYSPAGFGFFNVALTPGTSRPAPGR
ncbi:MAG: hypothetical protein B5M56_11025, partial [Desulfococcus sp. 4484_241]